MASRRLCIVITILEKKPFAVSFFFFFIPQGKDTIICQNVICWVALIKQCVTPGLVAITNVRSRNCKLALMTEIQVAVSL